MHAACFPSDDAHTQTRRALLQLNIDQHPLTLRAHRTSALRAGPRRAPGNRARSTPRACPTRYASAWLWLHGDSHKDSAHLRLRVGHGVHVPEHRVRFINISKTNPARLQLNTAWRGHYQHQLGSGLRGSMVWHDSTDLVQGGTWFSWMSFMSGVLRTGGGSKGWGKLARK